MYWETVRSSSDTTRKDAPSVVEGKGTRDATEDVDTGTGLVITEAAFVFMSTRSVKTDIEPTTSSSDSDEDVRSTAIAVGGGMFAGRAKLRGLVERSGSKTRIADAAAKSTARSSDHAAVTGVGSSSFRRTSPLSGEKTIKSPFAVVMSTTSSKSVPLDFLRFLRFLVLVLVLAEAVDGVEAQQIVVTLLAPSTSHSAITRSVATSHTDTLSAAPRTGSARAKDVRE